MYIEPWPSEVWGETLLFLVREDTGQRICVNTDRFAELLRVLEYYDGMLILTTNRLCRFDHAVMSRLNLAIKYPKLSPNRKSDIFLHFVNQLDEESVLDKERIHAWIKDEEGREVGVLNGRQIRNIVFSAARMSAVQEGRKLSLAAIKQLTQATKIFSLDIQADIAASRVKNEPMNSTM